MSVYLGHQRLVGEMYMWTSRTSSRLNEWDCTLIFKIGTRNSTYLIRVLTSRRPQRLAYHTCDRINVAEAPMSSDPYQRKTLRSSSQKITVPYQPCDAALKEAIPLADPRVLSADWISTCACPKNIMLMFRAALHNRCHCTGNPSGLGGGCCMFRRHVFEMGCMVPRAEVPF